VPVGVPGELHIGGDGLARGYLHRPELTAEKFIPHPFSQDPEARLYKTGDLARCLRCGDIDFLGRIDHQVKIRGFRIELGEIEAALAEHPQVKDVAVVACEDASGGESLVAYVVRGAGQSPTTDELRRTLKRKLPAYMLPSRFVFLHALPLMPNGKIDRNSLALSTPFKSKAGNTCMGARSPLEGQILQIWEELLEARPIGVQDDFFELGGNSLLAVRLMYRIEQACGKRLPLATVFAGATVEYLATALLNAGQERLRRPLVEVQAGGANPPFFFCHGGYGGGSYCRRLAQQLGKEQPFWAIAPNGLEGELIPTTIEGMAAERLGTLLDRRPNGPYLLGGYCNGGLVAFEMARQMGKMGLKVDLLVVVEASATNVRFRWLRRSLGLLGFLFGRDRESLFTWFVRFRDFFTVYSQ